MPHDKEFNQNKANYNDLKNKKSTGSTTTYDPYNEKNKGGDTRTPRAGLAHELLGHGWDADQGKTDYNLTSNGIPMFEVNAIKIENIVRSVTGDPKRTTTGQKSIPEDLLNNAP